LIYSGKQDAKEISTWILDNFVPIVFELNDDYNEQIFQGKRNALFLFRNEKNAD